MSDDKIQRWRCPHCLAAPRLHGRGDCKHGETTCNGFLCQCEANGLDSAEVFDALHGKIASNPCRHAKCDHCGWYGTYPADSLQVVLGQVGDLKNWEKEALDHGWTPPPGWTPQKSP